MQKRTKAFSGSAMAVYLLLSFAKCGNTLNLEGAKEQSCFKIENTVPMDLNWFASIKLWYYPLMNRYDLYNTAIDIVNKTANEISEDDLYYDGCIVFEPVAPLVFRQKGFNGQSSVFKSKSLGAGLDIVEFTVNDGASTKGTCYTTLTDNKTFFVSPCCVTGKNQMMWAASSTVPTLPKETVKLIHDHVESLGFKREFFSRLQYDSCKLGDVGQA